MNEIVKQQTNTVTKYRRNLILLMSERLISMLGVSAFNFALSLYVLNLTKSSVAFSTLLSFAIIPGVCVNILAGVYVDVHNKKKTLIISEVLSGIGVLLFMSL